MAKTNAPTPMAHEDAFFADEDLRLLEKMRRERKERAREQAEQEGEKERQRLKELHWMHCPKCGHDMAVQDLDGVEVDKCGTCEGIFFDRGELEELFTKQQAQTRTGLFRRILGLTD